MPTTAADMIVHIGADTKDAEAGFRRVGDSVNKGGASIAKTGLIMGGVAAGVAAGFGLAINGAMNFEGAMADVSASLGTTEEDYKNLSQLAINIGRDTAFSATQGAQAIEELGKAGVDIENILSGAGMAAAQLASATGSDIPTAANVMANSLNAFGLAGTDAARVADVMTAAINESSLSMPDFAAGLASAGAAAHALDIPIEDTAAALAIFSNAGLSGSDAGTSLRSMLTRLAAPTDEAAELMASLGINAFDAQGNFIGLEQFAGQLATGMKDLTDEQRANALATIFGMDAQRAANFLFQAGAEGMAEMSAKMQSNGQAAEAARRRLGGLRGAMEQLHGSLETAFILFGSMLTPVITRVAKGLTNLLNRIVNLSRPLKMLVGIVAGVIGGLAALGAGMAAVMAVGTPLIAGIGALGAGFLAILGPIALIVAAIAGLYWAWQNNFGGIRDFVVPIIDTVVNSLRGLIDFMTFAATSTGAAGALFMLLPGWMRPAANSIARVADAFQVMKAALDRDGLGGLLDVLPGQLLRIGDAFKNIGILVLRAFVNLPWGDIAASVWSGLLSVGASLGDFAVTIVGYLGDLGGELANWISREASEVEWGNALSTAARSTGNIVGAIVEGLGNLTVALGYWLSTQASSVDWSGLLRSAAKRAGNIVGAIVEGLGDLGRDLKTWYDTGIESVEWGNMGFIVGQKVGSLAETLAPKAVEMVVGFGDAIIHADWATIGRVIFGFIIALPATIAYVGATMGPKALEFLQGFVAGLGINWDVVRAWFADLPGRLLRATPGLLDALLTRAVELMIGFKNAIINTWPQVREWLAGMATRAFGAVGSLLASLPGRGVELIKGVQTGIDQQWPKVAAWLGLLGNLAWHAVKSLASALLSRGQELMDGVKTGLEQRWVTVKNWLALVGSLAYYAVGDLGGWLFQRGWDLMMGLWSGISAGFEWIIDQVSGFAGRLVEAKGPRAYDLRVMIPTGNYLMEGLGIGLEQGMQKIERQLAGYAPALAATANVALTASGSGAAFTAPATGNNVVYNDYRTFEVKVDDLPELIQAKEFFDDLERDRELVYGSR